MLNFLRKFKGLSAPGSEEIKDTRPPRTTGKYLRYAVGEIFLVVIGILIALSINNLNAERKQQKTEWKTIEALKAELEANISEITNIYQFNKKTSDTLSLFVNGELVFQNSQDKARIIRVVAGFAPFKINAPILAQELGNNNKILVRTEITNKLRNLEFTYSSLTTNMSYLDKFWNDQFLAHMIKEGQMTSFSSGYINHLPPTPAFITLFDSPEYKNLISAQGMLLLAVVWSQQAAIDQSKDLLEYLKTLEQ
ncbi:MAG: hypothetical protein HEP71_29940 [Roseivirga sp.]|nr:hypothetical protein [Roseivirga sp.]